MKKQYRWAVEIAYAYYLGNAKLWDTETLTVDAETSELAGKIGLERVELPDVDLAGTWVFSVAEYEDESNNGGLGALFG